MVRHEGSWDWGGGRVLICGVTPHGHPVPRFLGHMQIFTALGDFGFYGDGGWGSGGIADRFGVGWLGAGSFKCCGCGLFPSASANLTN